MTWYKSLKLANLSYIEYLWTRYTYMHLSCSHIVSIIIVFFRYLHTPKEPKVKKETKSPNKKNNKASSVEFVRIVNTESGNEEVNPCDNDEVIKRTKFVLCLSKCKI